MKAQGQPYRGAGDETGMTLIEVMVASMIFLVGILGLGMLQINAIKGNAVARSMTEASNAASDCIEQIMTAVWEEGRLGGHLTTGRHTEAVNGYAVSWKVIDAPDGRSKTVKVTVNWTVDGHSKQLKQVMVRSLK